MPSKKPLSNAEEIPLFEVPKDPPRRRPRKAPLPECPKCEKAGIRKKVRTDPFGVPLDECGYHMSLRFVR